MLKWTGLLVIALVSVEPAFAEEAPLSMRVGLHTGIEEGSTVTLASDPDRREGLLLLGIDGDSFVDQFVIGGGVTVGGGPFSYGSVRAGMHAGVAAPSTSLVAMATGELGVQWIENICPLFHSDPCGSDALPYIGLRGSFGYAFEHVEVALWSHFLVDLGRDHITSGNEYNIGGYMFGAGLSVAYVRRRVSGQ